MIRWLVQSSADIPYQANEHVEKHFLSVQENEAFHNYKVEKRRQEWLLGRWTAKRLVQSIIQQRTGDRPRLDLLEIYNDSNGAPHVSCGVPFDHIVVELSISHSGNRAFCAAADVTDFARPSTFPLGADLEHVQPRPAGFVEDYFTVQEIASVNTATDEDRDGLITAIWSAKESVLKACHFGLSVDTRSLTCLILPEEGAHHFWSPFTLIWEPKILSNTDLALIESSQLAGWWLVETNDILSIAAHHTLLPLDDRQIL